MTLLVPGAGPGAAGGLTLYDPAEGTVGPVDLAALAQGRGDVAGWTHPWWLIGPVG